MTILNYLPEFYAAVLETVQLTASEDAEFSALQAFLPQLVDEAAVLRAGEARLGQWEALLALTPQGSLAQRRMLILATLKGRGKLTEARIKAIVASFTGDPDAEVTFHHSRLKIRIYPPGNGEVFLFPAVEQALRPLIPAHLDLGVERWYCTWGDLKQRKTDWQEARGGFASWNELKMWNLEV